MGRNPLSSAPWQPEPRDCCPLPDMISLIAMYVSEEWGRRKGGRRVEEEEGREACGGGRREGGREGGVWGMRRREMEKKRCTMREVGEELAAVLQGGASSCLAERGLAGVYPHQTRSSPGWSPPPAPAERPTPSSGDYPAPAWLQTSGEGGRSER